MSRCGSPPTTTLHQEDDGKMSKLVTGATIRVSLLYIIINIPYSRKYWRELNLVVEPKIAIARILADLNLAVRYGIAICIYVSRKFWQILIWQL